MDDICPLDIWYAILQHCDFLSRLRLISVCSTFYHSLFITDMYDIPNAYKNKLTNLTLKQKKFSKIIRLNISKKNDINDVLFLTNLKQLNISHDCGVDQSGICGLDLSKLNASFNDKIKDVSFMSSLKKLNICDNHEIDQDGIRGLNLTELKVSHNQKIKNISFMTSLKKLIISDYSGIDQQEINGL